VAAVLCFQLPQLFLGADIIMCADRQVVLLLLPLQVVPVPLPLVSAISTLRISIPADLRAAESRKAGGWGCGGGSGGGGGGGGLGRCTRSAADWIGLGAVRPCKTILSNPAAAIAAAAQP
jgi:hypothetical protein